jgi:hypothetical protein
MDRRYFVRSSTRSPGRSPRDPNPIQLWVGETRTLDEIHQSAVWLLDNHGAIESISDDETSARRVRL